MIIPLFLYDLFLAPLFPSTHALIGDWFNLINYGTLFMFGFLLIAMRDVFWQTVTKNRYTYLTLGMTAFPLLMILWFGVGEFYGTQYLSSFVKVLNIWSWILAIFGFGSVYLNKPGRFLTYANESVYPLYILHQTVIVVLCYYLKQTNWGFMAKFSLMVLGTFGTSILIYEFGIRRYRWIRPLFGLKNK